MTTSSEWPDPPPGWPAEQRWPPVPPSLDDAFDKLRWAKKHFESLRVEIEPFEQRDAHTIRFEAVAETGTYMFYIEGLEEPEDAGTWGLMIGDCLHNARTALDYLMVRLVALVTGQHLRYVDKVQFPIYDEPKRFGGAISELRKMPTFSGYLARIEELQPFNRSNPSVWGATPQERGGEIRTLFPQPSVHALPSALNRLALLDNFDKHRIIHATWVGIKKPEPFAEPSFMPADFELAGSNTNLGPLENGAEIGSMEFRAPLPHEWHPNELDMKRHFPISISLEDELAFPNRVMEVLPSCIWAVESVLTLFSPVFSELKPPLLVTAIPNPS